MTEPVGPNQCFMCSGSVKAFHTSSRGASNTREMTKSVLFVAAFIFASTGYAPLHLLLFDQDHPADAEFVGDHAESGREERFRKRHLHLPAIGQRIETALAFGGVGRGDGQRKALEVRLTEATAVEEQIRLHLHGCLLVYELKSGRLLRLTRGRTAAPPSDIAAKKFVPHAS